MAQTNVSIATPEIDTQSIRHVPAPAKLNLFLHVLGRRPDGYHLLQSVFVLIDWADTLHFERRRDGQIKRHDLGPRLPEDDLCCRAARALATQAQVPWGADIFIDKQVPWGAGLGGGSSDAASCLLALNRLWELHWPLPRLAALGLSLGADVPFFLGGHNAFIEGIGETLTPIELPRQWLAVLKPSASVATAKIFSSPLLARHNDAIIVADFIAKAGITRLTDGFGVNTLQAVAQAECPQILEAATVLQNRFGNSRMTGSGSAVFARAGLWAHTPEPPDMVAPQDVPPGWVGRMCCSLERHPLLGWAPS